MMNGLLVLIAVLVLIVIVQGVIIVRLLNVKNNYAKRIKRRREVEKKKDLKIASLRAKVEEMQKEFSNVDGSTYFHEKEAKKWKKEAREYAYAMQNIVELYGKACETISNYLREGLLIRSFSENTSSYEYFTTTWRDLQSRRYIETYKFRDILDDPEELEFLFGTSDMNYLAEVFQ